MIKELFNIIKMQHIIFIFLLFTTDETVSKQKSRDLNPPSNPITHFYVQDRTIDTA